MVQGSLRYAIGHHSAYADVTRARGNIDDAATAALEQPGSGQAAEDEGGGSVPVEMVAEGFRGRVQERGVVTATGVVDHDVDATAALYRGVHQGGQLVLLHHVGNQRFGTPARLLDQLNSFIDLSCSSRRAHYVRTTCRHRQGDAASHTPTGTGYDSDLAIHAHAVQKIGHEALL